jgi:hypothetical protein
MQFGTNQISFLCCRADSVYVLRLSSPVPYLSHAYRPEGSHPGLIYAPDMIPDQRNAWEGYGMPCACFFYSRTSNDNAFTASNLDTAIEDDAIEDEELLEYRPAQSAALAWRHTALCHIAMILESLEQGRESARYWAESTGDLAGLKKAVAPSFQASALGPAIFLATKRTFELPPLDHEAWMEAMAEEDGEGLLRLLKEAGIGSENGGTTCLDLAKKNPEVCLISTFASTFSSASKRQRQALRVEPLPYAAFPPGMSFFAHDQERGIRPCVVHANYVMGAAKEEMLRVEKLWALREDESTCDMRVIRNAGENATTT